jgi:hypothetical protein
VIHAREAVQNLQQVGRAELGRSTSRGNLLRQRRRLQLPCPCFSS